MQDGTANVQDGGFEMDFCLAIYEPEWGGKTAAQEEFSCSPQLWMKSNSENSDYGMNP